MQITQKNIFLKIWTAPREVFKFINDNQYGRYFTLLLILSATLNGFKKTAKQNGLSELFFWEAVSFIMLQALFLYIIYYIYAASISWSGKFINGKEDTQSILRVLSYAMLPSILGIFFLIPLITVYGADILKSNKDFPNANPIYIGFAILNAALNIWTIVLCVIGLSEVQKFSIWKSILNMVVAAILPISILLAVLSLFISFK
ncbi:MAG: Yip1 family protein [Flavobacterium sp.]